MILRVGDLFPISSVTSLQGLPVALPVAQQGHGRPLTHVQFRRFAGCPICNLHLRGVARRNDELRAHGVAEVAVFHADRDTMLPYQGDLPFVVVADPTWELYRAVGADRRSVVGLLHPGAWAAGLKGMVGPFATNPLGSGDHLGLPSEFLIDAERIVRAVKYGDHADDQWSVDEVLTLALSLQR